MASSSTGASLGSSTLQNSGSEGGGLQHVMDQRKRKRMLSNRESARRSRQRKQKHLDDLINQICQLTKENKQILTSMNMTSHVYLNIEAENSILRTQMAELSQRLQSLNEIVNYVNSTNGLLGTGDGTDQTTQDNSLMQPSSYLYMNHPIMASADIFMY